MCEFAPCCRIMRRLQAIGVVVCVALVGCSTSESRMCANDYGHAKAGNEPDEVLYVGLGEGGMVGLFMASDGFKRGFVFPTPPRSGASALLQYGEFGPVPMSLVAVAEDGAYTVNTAIGWPPVAGNAILTISARDARALYYKLTDSHKRNVLYYSGTAMSVDDLAPFRGTQSMGRQ